MKYLIGFISLFVFLTGCTSKPILNVNNEFIPTNINNEQPSFDAVEKAIILAAKKRGWNSHVIQPGLIEAQISLRNYRATVQISYSRSTYSISYKDSENLNYDDGEIHRNYNSWVGKLSRTIQKEMGLNSRNNEINNHVKTNHITN